MSRSILTAIIAWLLLSPLSALSASEPISAREKSVEKLRLEILQPYVELHTGPGKNYPVFYIAQRGEEIEVQKRRNDWYKVTLQASHNISKSGWIHRRHIVDQAVANIGSNRITAKDHPALQTALNPKVYLGFNYGRSPNDDLAGIYAGYALTSTLALELQAGEILGQTRQETTWSLNASFTPFDDDWRVAPFFQIGSGGIDSEARSTNSQQNDGSDKFFQTTAGLGVLLSNRYRLRFEYRHMNILQSRNQNRDLETWHIGFIGYF